VLSTFAASDSILQRRVNRSRGIPPSGTPRIGNEAMGEENQQVLRRNVSVVLDEILARHMERLLGSRLASTAYP